MLGSGHSVALVVMMVAAVVAHESPLAMQLRELRATIEKQEAAESNHVENAPTTRRTTTLPGLNADAEGMIRRKEQQFAAKEFAKQASTVTPQCSGADCPPVSGDSHPLPRQEKVKFAVRFLSSLGPEVCSCQSYADVCLTFLLYLHTLTRCRPCCYVPGRTILVQTHPQ